MRTIVKNGIIFLLCTMASCEFHHNNDDDNSSVPKRKDTVAFTVFSIDGDKAAANKNKRLDFYYHDSLAFGHPVTITEQYTKLLLTGPTLILQANDKQTPFLIFPGEMISLRYAKSDTLQMYIRGNQQRTNELNFFRKLVQKTGNIYYAYTVMPYHLRVTSLNNLQLFEKKINGVKNERIQFLNTYSHRFSISNGFIKIATNCIKSTAITDSLILFFSNQKLLKKQNLYNKVIAEKLLSIKNIGFMPFQIYYNACETLVSLSITDRVANYVINNDNEFVRRFNFIDKNFDETLRDFLLSNTLYAAYTNAIPVSKEYIDKFNTKCTNKGYKAIINKKLSDKETIIYPKGNNNLLFTDNKSVQDIKSVISKYKGKMVLLDFWASWCGPCRAEMPYTAKLKKLYREKNIVFVSIATDSNIDDWLRANKEESLGNDDSYLLLNAQNSTFVRQNNINSIPRYMLLGKDGKILRNDAPRPSDQKLKKIIDKYL